MLEINRLTNNTVFENDFLLFSGANNSNLYTLAIGCTLQLFLTKRLIMLMNMLMNMLMVRDFPWETTGVCLDHQTWLNKPSNYVTCNLGT